MLAQQFAELVGLPQGWSVSIYGDSFICPCGTEIELDGRCPEDHVSPMLAAGMI